MNNVLLWIGGVLVLVLCALFAVPHFVNWNLYRGAFEEEASRLLARDVRVSGGVSVRFLPVPYVSFEKVRIGEAVPGAGAETPQARAERPAAIGSGEPVLRVERFTMGLSITDLLRGSISAHEIEMVRPEVRVSLGEQGASLLALLTPTSADAAQAPAGQARGAFTIDTLKVSNGSIVLLGPDRGEALVVSEVNGDITQATGGGSPKFRGTAMFAGDVRDVRIATADNGSGVLKVKSQIRTLTSSTTYAFDGTVSGLQRALVYDGEISAKLPIGSLRSGADAKATALDAFELKGRVKGDANALGVDDLALSFERDGKPQVITGSSRVSWVKGVDATAQLSSRWLDLDRIFVSDGGARPVDIAAWIARSLGSAAPKGTRLAASFAVDSLTLGGEQLSDVAVSIAGLDGLVTVEKATGRVPGGRIEITGRTADDRKSFRGTVFVKAASARRLLGWLASGTAAPQPRVDGTLLLDAQFQAEATSIRTVGRVVQV